MIQTINVSDFRAAFHSMGRKDQFSYEGLGALFDYLEEFDGGSYELDVIALCCDYSEDSPEDIAEAIIYLATSTTLTTGQCLVVDGGRTM